MKIYILLAFVIWGSLISNAQVTVSEPVNETSRIAYKNEIEYIDPIYGAEDSEREGVDLNLCVSYNGYYYLRSRSKYLYQSLIKITSPRLSSNKVVSKFYLSDNKEGAINSLKTIIESITKLHEGQYIEIKDCFGSPFLFSAFKYRKVSEVIDFSIPLINGKGKDFDAFGFKWDIKYLEDAVKDSNKWK